MKTSQTPRKRHQGRILMALLLIIIQPSLILAAEHQKAEAMRQSEIGQTRPQDHPYVGMWVTADGAIRHELLPNGRYDEARGNRQSAYQGRYEVKGDHIDYGTILGSQPMAPLSTGTRFITAAWSCTGESRSERSKRIVAVTIRVSDR